MTESAPLLPGIKPHRIEPDVIRELHDKYHHSPSGIAHIFARPENEIREVLGLPKLPAHRIKEWAT